MSGPERTAGAVSARPSTALAPTGDVLTAEHSAAVLDGGSRRAIAVDGLSGAGKSTVSRRVAAALGWAYLDTGACYRAIAVAALRAGRVRPGADRADGSLRELARAALDTLEMSIDPQVSSVWLAAEDVTTEIRSPATTASVSAVAADPGVRAEAVRWQRQRVLAADGCVVEGRDIGTVVLPDAALKIWLTASPARRSARRAEEVAAEAAATQAALDRRDRLDSGRAVDPARPAHDAVVVDTDELDVDGVVRRVLALATDHGLVGR